MIKRQARKAFLQFENTWHKMKAFNPNSHTNHFYP